MAFPAVASAQGLAFFMYDKPYLPVSDQLKLLIDRGMLIEDHAKAAEYLHRIGYYRLSAYWHPMKRRCLDTGRAMDQFVEGTTFKQATDLYTFDGRLRLIMLDAFERLEVALRTDTALRLGSVSPSSHRDGSNFGPAFSNRKGKHGPTKHREWLSRLDDKALRSKDKFAEHFRTKYPDDDMPIWIAVELLDFGPLSHLLGGMKNTDLAKIGANYGGLKPPLVKSWAHSLAFSRNVCAHHSRLWNKPLVNQPAMTPDSVPPSLRHVTIPPRQERYPSATTRLYAIACIAKYMLDFANPRTSWKTRFKSHIQTFPATQQLHLASAGFPDNWREMELWRD